jgi:hypothetical protein
MNENVEFWRDLREVFKQHNRCLCVSGYDFDGEIDEYSERGFLSFKGSFEYESEPTAAQSPAIVGIGESLKPPDMTPFLTYLLMRSGGEDPNFKMFEVKP